MDICHPHQRLRIIIATHTNQPQLHLRTLPQQPQSLLISPIILIDRCHVGQNTQIIPIPVLVRIILTKLDTLCIYCQGLLEFGLKTVAIGNMT